jgi:hypothetical protein
MNDSDRSDDWKQQETIIAIEGNNPGEWHYTTYPNWDEAMEAVKVARRQGKAAVIYSGATPPVPPEL